MYYKPPRTALMYCTAHICTGWLNIANYVHIYNTPYNTRKLTDIPLKYSWILIFRESTNLLLLELQEHWYTQLTLRSMKWCKLRRIKTNYLVYKIQRNKCFRSNTIYYSRLIKLQRHEHHTASIIHNFIYWHACVYLYK